MKKKIETFFDSIVESLNIDILLLLKIAFYQCLICLGITFVWNADIIICGVITDNWRSQEWLIVNICLFIYWLWCEQFYNASKRIIEKWKR